MAAETAKPVVTDYAVAPGETVLEVIESLGITQADLAERTGRPKKTINEIINGKAAITPETAVQFERVLGVPASFWASLEQNYRATLTRLAERERLKRQVGWLQDLPVKALAKRGWVPSADSAVEQMEALLSYYGVASVDAWRTLWTGVREAVAYRHSPSFASDFGAVTAWLRRGEIVARDISSQPYDTARFREILSAARPWCREKPEVFTKKLRDECAKAGVVVLFVPELPQMRVCGATRWLAPDRALVLLTLRYKSEDHLWFTFFHEAAHILLHGKREIFIEDQERSSSIKVSEYSADRAKAEKEANAFAADTLIPPARYESFLEKADLSPLAIRTFAKEIAITPGIVVGRLQFDGIIPFGSALNRLKRRYDWAEDRDS
jgi:HTH-type transcriptional regulator/antitoxin HigA